MPRRSWLTEGNSKKVKSLKRFILERPRRSLSAARINYLRLHCPRYFSFRVRYQAGRNFWRIYLGPIIIDVWAGRRSPGE